MAQPIINSSSKDHLRMFPWGFFRANMCIQRTRIRPRIDDTGVGQEE